MCIVMQTKENGKGIVSSPKVASKIVLEQNSNGCISYIYINGVMVGNIYVSKDDKFVDISFHTNDNDVPFIFEVNTFTDVKDKFTTAIRRHENREYRVSSLKVACKRES